MNNITYQNWLESIDTPHQIEMGLLYFIRYVLKHRTCALGNHDWEYTKPLDVGFNDFYRKVECKCGEFHRSKEHLDNHFIYDAPLCALNRVCMECGKTDLRLDKEVLRLQIKGTREKIAEEHVRMAKDETNNK